LKIFEDERSISKPTNSTVETDYVSQDRLKYLLFIDFTRHLKEPSTLSTTTTTTKVKTTTTTPAQLLPHSVLMIIGCQSLSSISSESRIHCLTRTFQFVAINSFSLNIITVSIVPRFYPCFFLFYIISIIFSQKLLNMRKNALRSISFDVEEFLLVVQAALTITLPLLVDNELQRLLSFIENQLIDRETAASSSESGTMKTIRLLMNALGEAIVSVSSTVTIYNREELITTLTKRVVFVISVRSQSNV
jgi:hypothetical protein